MSETILETTGLIVSLEEAELIRQFLDREASLRDDRDYDAWLDCYRGDAPFWMPAWDVDETLTSAPQTEISLIYYPDRSGIVDRVFRIKTERSSATSIPEPRVGHNITDVEFLTRDEEDQNLFNMRFNWFTLYFRKNTTST